MTTASLYWSVDQHQALDAAVRAWLLANYGYTAPAEHTYAALISIRAEGAGGVTCVETFPFSFVLAGALTGDLEAQIDAEAKARLLAIRNAEPLASILDTRHPL